MLTLNCPYCGSTLRSIASIKGQMYKAYKQIRVKIKCPSCHRDSTHNFKIVKVGNKNRNELRCPYCEKLINPGVVGFNIEEKNGMPTTKANCLCRKTVTIRLKQTGAVRQSDIVDMFRGI